LVFFLAGGAARLLIKRIPKKETEKEAMFWRRSDD
jgi:hypothetical protein